MIRGGPSGRVRGGWDSRDLTPKRRQMSEARKLGCQLSIWFAVAKKRKEKEEEVILIFFLNEC